MYKVLKQKMVAKTENVSKKDDYIEVAPDGGWGYVVCGSAVVIFIIVCGFMPSFGLVYKDIIDEVGMGSTEISLLNGITAIFFAFAGFFTGFLLHYSTKRQLSLFSIVMYCCGNLIAVFNKSVMPMYVICALQGAGFGILFNVTMALINEYFVEKRLFAMSLVQTAQGALLTFIPQCVTILQSFYGFIGTRLIITCVTLQGFIAVALMQPAAWHMKKVHKIPITEEKQVLLLEETNVSTLKINDMESFQEYVEDKAKNNNKTSWIMSVLKNIFDVPVILQMLKTNICWSVSLTTLTDSVFTMIMPQALYSYGWNDKSVALAVTLMSLGDLTGRLFFTVFSKWIKIGSQELCIIGLLCTVFSRVGMLCSTSETIILVFIAALGFSRCFLVLFLPLVVADAVSLEKFPAAMGFVMLMIGISCLGLGPVAGAIRDYTNSFEATFWVFTGLNAACVVSWTTEIVYKRSRSHKNKGNL